MVSGRMSGHVAAEHENAVVCRNGLAGALDGMAGAELLGLVNETNAGGLHGGADYLRLMADDGVDVLNGNDAAGGVDDMREKRPAADLMEDLGALGVEPRSLARRHDEDCPLGA